MNSEQLNLESLKRVSVVGTSCSGKTTFARNLANILKTKHIQLDAINFLPDWVERPNEEFLDVVEKAAAEDVWVFDGNYTRTREIVWGRAGNCLAQLFVSAHFLPFGKAHNAPHFHRRRTLFRKP